MREKLTHLTAEFTYDFSSAYSKAIMKNQGLSVAEVAQEVRTAVFPTTAATIKRGDDEIDIEAKKNHGCIASPFASYCVHATTRARNILFELCCRPPD